MRDDVRSPDYRWPDESEADDANIEARSDHDEMVALAGELEELAGR